MTKKKAKQKPANRPDLIPIVGGPHDGHHVVEYGVTIRVLDLEMEHVHRYRLFGGRYIHDGQEGP